MTYDFSQPPLHKHFLEFVLVFRRYLKNRVYERFTTFEWAKDLLILPLYKQRGKYSRQMLHAGMTILVFTGVTIGPLVLNKVNAAESPPDVLPTGVLASVTDYNQLTTTQGKEVAEYRGGEILLHEVKDKETVDTIAKLYNLQPDTIIWLNELNPYTPKVKVGQKLKILPVDGVLHKVRKGETIYTIAKLYGLDDAQAQGIVNYPFNTFANDETFALSVGQDLVVPDGVKKFEDSLPSTPVAERLTPSAGAVTPTGQFVWPAAGKITQGFKFYHKAYDIANHSGGPILAADSGTITVAGWVDNTGYGNRVMIDHGNGYVTLYGHMSLISVRVGQTVRKGDVLGQMGSTGRSTGTHCHFEIRHNGVLEDPGWYLK